MISIDTTRQKLFDLLVAKGFDVTTRDSHGKETADPKNADMFSFNYKVDDDTYGSVVLTISPDGELEVYYGDVLGKGMDTAHKNEWYDFLYQLRHFSKRHMLEFNLKHMNKLKYSMQTMSQVQESKYYGFKKTSYTKPTKEAKLKIKHSKPIDEEQGDQRYRNVASLYVETSEGERFKLPFKKLYAGRAMARHVSEGGNPYDSFGCYISELVDDINTLGAFTRYAKGQDWKNSDTAGLAERGIKHFNEIKRKVKSMVGKRGYKKALEAFEQRTGTPGQETLDKVRELFTEKLLDTRVESALPVLTKLELEGKPMKEINEFEQWADKTSQLDLAEGFDPDTFDGKVTVPGRGGLPTDITYTAEIDHEQNRVRVIKCSNDQYQDECQDDAEAEFDNRDVDMPMETSTYGSITDPADNSDAELKREAVHDAILRRFQNHLDLVIKIGGPAETMDAIKQYADEHDWSDIQEIGTSDVSAWVDDIVRDNQVTEEKMLEDDPVLSADLKTLSNKAFLQKRKHKKTEWGPAVFEGKMKDLALDLEDLNDAEFFEKYKQKKSDWQEVKDKGLRQDPNKKAYIGKMNKVSEAEAYRDNDTVYTDSEIDRAVRIANHMKGDMTDATDAIEALHKGLTNHPKVAGALRSANESVDNNNNDDYDAKADQDAMDYEAEFDLQDTDDEIGHEIDDNIEVDSNDKSLLDMLKKAGVDYKEIYVDNEGNIEEDIEVANLEQRARVARGEKAPMESIEDELDSEEYKDAMRQLMQNAGYDHLDIESKVDRSEPTEDEVEAYKNGFKKPLSPEAKDKLMKSDRLKNFLDTEDDPYDISEDYEYEDDGVPTIDNPPTGDEDDMNRGQVDRQLSRLKKDQNYKDYVNGKHDPFKAFLDGNKDPYENGIEQFDPDEPMPSLGKHLKREIAKSTQGGYKASEPVPEAEDYAPSVGDQIVTGKGTKGTVEKVADHSVEFRTEAGQLMKTVLDNVNPDAVNEDDVDEGNEFSGALAQAKRDGKDEFEVDGKVYQVKEDTKQRMMDLVNYRK